MHSIFGLAMGAERAFRIMFGADGGAEPYQAAFLLLYEVARGHLDDSYKAIDVVGRLCSQVDDRAIQSQSAFRYVLSR